MNAAIDLSTRQNCMVFFLAHFFVNFKIAILDRYVE